MIVLFVNDQNDHKAFDVGSNIDLQDALNVTLNEDFIPTKIILETNPNIQITMEETQIPDLIKPKLSVGKHTFDEILSKHNVPKDKLITLLDEGMAHEMEHTDDPAIAIAIAQDHIYETLDYYRRLKDLKLQLGGMTMKMAQGGRVSSKPRLPKQNKMFHLPIEMAVYVPSTSNVSTKIHKNDLSARVTMVKRTLASMFGGYTSADAVGGYVTNEGALVNEDVVRVVAYSTPEAFKENKLKLMKMIAKWAKEWGQEAIGFEYEGDLFYIDANYKEGGIIPPPDYSNLTLEDI